MRAEYELSDLTMFFAAKSAREDSATIGFDLFPRFIIDRGLRNLRILNANLITVSEEKGSVRPLEINVLLLTRCLGTGSKELDRRLRITRSRYFQDEILGKIVVY